MTKREFLKQLRKNLSQLPEVERDQVLLYWSEAIDDRLEAGMSEQEIFYQLETPDVIALRILSELHQQSVAATKVVWTQDDDDDEDDEGDDDDDDDDDEDDDDDDDEGDDDEDDDDDDDDEDDGGDESKGGWNFQVKIPPIPEIKIPPIPEIKIPFLSDVWGESESTLRHRKLQAKPDNVKKIHVLDHNNSIEIQPAADDLITIEWTENKYHRYEPGGNGGVLSLIHQKPEILVERVFMRSRREPVVVYLPQGYRGALDIETSNASIKIDDVKLFAPVKAKASNGSIKMENLNLYAQLDAVTSNSSIKLESVQSMALLDLRTSNSTIKAECVQAYGLKAVTSNSTLSLEEVKVESQIDARTSNGKLVLEDVIAPVIVAGTSNASISVEAVNANDLTLTTSNGFITGELAGSAAEYEVKSDTSHGKNENPSRPGGPRRLKAHTSNGSIKLTFAKE